MYPQAYLAYLVHFHGDRDYFECHEILEEYWKSLPPTERSSVWVGLIQIAVALYHQRRGNYAGAAKMMESAVRILAEEQQHVRTLGLEAAVLVSLLQGRLHEIRKQKPYESINLPLTDVSLLKRCQELCERQGTFFGQASDLQNHHLINKHTLRDRSEVIRERDESLRKKQAKRGEADQRYGNSM
jgi:predicted metal-dependent hydrolase